MRSQLYEVARREVVTRIRSKGFQAITGLMALIALAAPIAAVLWPEGSDEAREVTIGIAEGLPDGLEQMITTIGGDDYDIDFVGLAAADVNEQLSDGDLDLVIEPGPILAWDQEVDFDLETLATISLNQLALIDRAERAGIDPNELRTLLEPQEIDERFSGGDRTDENVRLAVSFAGLFLAFMMPLIFGQFTMMSVIEEKSTRVIEVLLSQLRPRTLLSGKILGISLLALVQLGVLLLGAIAGLLLVDRFEVPSSVWRFIPILLVSLLAGLVLYNTFFALLGSLISRQEDQQQVVFPAMIPIMVGYFVGQSALFGDATTPLLKLLTWFPLTAPMILPLRVAKDAIEPWEIALSLTLLALAVVLMHRLASKVYEFSLLRLGSRMSWSEVFGRLRGSIAD